MSNRRRPLTRSTILLYCTPVPALGFMGFFTAMYLLKFSTDVLGIAPVAMGAIFAVSRIWDAVSDPIAGYLSDNTRTRIGRRRPWLIGGALPVGLIYVLLWAPPAGLGERAIVLWMGAAVLLFYSGMTIIGMPHDSLGAELSEDYDERTRLFGIRRLAFGIGALPAFVAIAVIPTLEDPRLAVVGVASVAAVLATVTTLLAGIGIREPMSHVGRGASRPVAAIRDVLRNPHARILLFVFFLQQLAVGVVTVMAPYFAEYVLGDPTSLGAFMGSFFVCSLLAIPVWIRLADRFDKRSMMLVGMLAVSVAFGGIAFVEPGDVVLASVFTGIAGAGAGGLDVLFPSIQADVIDYDELHTGERKEGVYFATWHFAAKTAIGISVIVVGFALSLGGFEPNVAQDLQASRSIQLVTSLGPLVCFAAGVLVFTRFELTRDQHADIREKLDARADRVPSPELG